MTKRDAELTRGTVGAGETVAAQTFAVEALAASIAIVRGRSGHFVSERERNRDVVPLQVVVRDNGPGIPDDIRPHLFEPFVSSKRTGSGLGLALVAKIVGDHGGLIEVDSRPGRTEFRLNLPVVTEKDAAV